jgi:hypothetical protein
MYLDTSRTLLYLRKMLKRQDFISDFSRSLHIGTIVHVGDDENEEAVLIVDMDPFYSTTLELKGMTLKFTYLRVTGMSLKDWKRCLRS